MSGWPGKWWLMENLSRRSVLTLGAALGLVTVTDVPKAWAWSSANSIAGTNTVTDPWDVWDDDTDPLVASLLDNGQIPAVNNAFKTFIKNGDPVPSGLPPRSPPTSGRSTSCRRGPTRPSWTVPPSSTSA